MTRSAIMQDVIAVILSVVIIFGLLLLFLLGFFGFNLLDFIDDCMEEE